MTKISVSARDRITSHGKEARTDDLLNDLKRGAVGSQHRKHKKRHQNEAAAQTDHRAERTDTGSE